MRNFCYVLFLELILFTQFLFLQKIKKHIIIILPPLLLVPEWSHLPLNSKGLAFYKCYFAKNVEFRFSKLQTHLLKIILFQPQHFFFTYNYCLSRYFALFTSRDKGERVLAVPFLRTKILWYAQNFQWVQNFIFLN